MLAPHQADAVERALELLASRRGVLLADDVGLGKSFVAAEVMRRHRQAELVVPAALVGQWRETLDRFEVEARIFTHDGLAGEAHYPQPGRRLVVVDEAHAFRNPRTRRYAALARRTAGARVMLITATPVCNGAADLEALLRIIARDDLLLDVGVPSIDVAFAAGDAVALGVIVGSLVIRRDRAVLPSSLQFGDLSRHVVRHPVPALRDIDALRFPLTGDSALLRRFLWRRLESSEAALCESLRRQLRFYERALAAIAAGRTLPKRDYRLAFAHEEDRDAIQQVLFWDLFAPAGREDPQAIREEVARIEELLRAVSVTPRLKRDLLRDLVRNRQAPMLIFTGAAATARDLHDALKRESRCGLVTSRERSREAVLAAFRSGRLDVVVSTDMAAEGLNLQRAGVVVHYDLPWNPVKLDQRNGRAHRIGQERDAVQAIYFIPDSRETGIVRTVARKNRVRRQTLRAGPEGTRSSPATLRPRVTGEAAITRLRAVVPDLLLRRHKAGLELLIDEMSREYLDQRRLDDLVALVTEELGA
ncbi:MAG: DEAD/DEAH box helicase [Acidobacteriota bacterium]